MDLLVFPNQLYSVHPGFRRKPRRVILIEDSLFFGDSRYPARFHKQKLWFHRSSMKRYERMLRDKGFRTEYIEYQRKESALRDELRRLRGKSRRYKTSVSDPTDFILERRIQKHCDGLNIDFEILPTPAFLNSREENTAYRAGKSRWFMADFYKWQRQRLDVLMDGDRPRGGRWSFDDENRKKVPKSLLGSLPSVPAIKRDEVDTEAKVYVEGRFPNNPGSLNDLYYPTSHRAARKWLKQFLNIRLNAFGDFEDAIVPGESWLWHSVLTPMLNTGLLRPKEVVKATIGFADQNDVPLNSLEGFLRQVIGWREFMRATYQDLGVTMRTTNYWQHHRKIPQSLYDGSTGVQPIDDTIERILKTGYCHHIERLMVLGGFMFLCEIDPDDVYRWFMEMFIDSYDWVMVPNVYAMSQNADGGLITTKPYFSGSAYIRKMSHYDPGPWCDIWDGLYWRWIWNHSRQLSKNPRWAMMCSTVKGMDRGKRRSHLKNAERFLNQLK